MSTCEGIIFGGLRQHTTHLVKLALIHLRISPRVSFNLLRVHLPFTEETDLFCEVRHRKVVNCAPTYNVYRIVHFAMCPELRLDIQVSKYTLFMR